MHPELFSTKEFYLTVNVQDTPGKIEILKHKRENSRPITYCMNFKSSFGEKEFMEILISNLIK